MGQCKRCDSNDVVKCGKVRGKQRYLCKKCGCHFVNGDERKDKTAVVKALWTLISAFGVDHYSKIADHLGRDRGQLYRWDCEMRSLPALECTDSLKEYGDREALISDIKRRLNEGECFSSGGVIGDAYVTVIVQKQDAAQAGKPES